MLHNVIATSQVSTAACQIQAEMPQKTSLTFLKTFLPTLYFFQAVTSYLAYSTDTDPVHCLLQADAVFICSNQSTLMLNSVTLL